MIAALALAALAAPGKLSFVVVGHVRADHNGELLQNLDEVIAEVERVRPDLVFLCGDLIWGDIDSPQTDRAAIEADWDALDRKLARLTMPVHRVPGNHDVCDVVTRDIWVQRYGTLPRALEVEGTRFLFLRSVWWPPDGSSEKHPERLIRGVDLDAEQITFLEHELALPHEHAFVFQHHMLWWEDSAAWWREVHPVLARGNVDAVFAGDYGPLKFSALERDGIDYLQTSIENRISLEMLRGNEASRYLSAQLDNFLYVTIDGPDVRIEVRTVGSLSSGKFSPQHFRSVQEYDRGTIERKLFTRWRSPGKLWNGVALVAAASFAAGALVALAVVLVLRSRSRAR